MANQHANSDYTKTRAYACADLFLKAISALAFVVIGFVTFSLQRRVEDFRETEQRRDLEERSYLPVLRSSSETGAILVEVAARYGWPKGTKEEALDESQLGARLSYAASSLQFPDHHEPVFDVIPAADIASDLPNPRHFKLPARTAILLLADIMRLSPLMLEMSQKHAVLTPQRDSLLFTYSAKKQASRQAVSTDERTRAAWFAWLDGAPQTAEMVYWLDLPTIADDLDRQLTTMNDTVIAGHPNLAKDYIEIRADVLRARQQLAPRQDESSAQASSRK